MNCSTRNPQTRPHVVHEGTHDLLVPLLQCHVFGVKIEVHAARLRSIQELMNVVGGRTGGAATLEERGEITDYAVLFLGDEGNGDLIFIFCLFFGLEMLFF